MNDERSWIVAHSSLDPLDLPSSLLEVLCYFDGRPTEDALKTIAAEHGIKLDASLIRKLTDFEVLVSTNES
jgi:hypothetical protein